MSSSITDSPNDARFNPGCDVTAQQWQYAQEMIEDVQSQLRSESFAQTVGAWSLAVRQFRRAEARMIHSKRPSEADRVMQKLCLTALLTGGEALLLRAKTQLREEDLKNVGITTENLSAFVLELEDSLTEVITCETQDPVIDSLRQRIFVGGSPVHH